MHYARVLSAALPLLSFFATGALAGGKMHSNTLDVTEYTMVGMHRQIWFQPGAFTGIGITDVVLKDGSQEFALLIVGSSKLDKVNINFSATKASVSLDRVEGKRNAFQFVTDVNQMDDVDMNFLRPCLKNIVKNSSKVVGSPYQDIDHCLKKFYFKVGNDPEKYYIIGELLERMG